MRDRLADPTLSQVLVLGLHLTSNENSGTKLQTFSFHDITDTIFMSLICNKLAVYLVFLGICRLRYDKYACQLATLVGQALAASEKGSRKKCSDKL